MTGRGIDQVLAYPSEPGIYESYVRSALGYVELAERVNGEIPKSVDFKYIWGDALVALERQAPDVRIINLETAVTTSENWLPKGINYRMHPKNVPCLTVADIDCCVLANNHVLDWGYPGLEETLATLKAAGLKVAGAGRDDREAAAPAVMEVPNKGRVIVFAFGSETSGIPTQWAASPQRPGVKLLSADSDSTVSQTGEAVRALKRPGDLVVASIHWGGNWGYRIPRWQRQLAHRLIDEAGVDVIHGHSSHHAKGLEIYRGKPVIYGCGDFLNDYEGISGQEAYRGDLPLMYFLTMDAASGRLARFEMTPLRIKRFRLQRASTEEARWLRETLDRESRGLGVRVELEQDDVLSVKW